MIPCIALLLALSETWLTDNESDHIYLKALTPPGYELFNVPRGGGDPHGGIAVLYKDAPVAIGHVSTDTCILTRIASAFLNIWKERKQKEKLN